MQIVLGSKNKAKIKAVSDVFKHDEILTVNSPSGVSNQPFSDDETLRGAINRSIHARKTIDHGLGIGLEGGVMEMDGLLFLTNWGALTDENYHTYVASGARVPIPASISEKLHAGIELGDVMAKYTQDQHIRHHNGAIGIFTNEEITRNTMFEHVIRQLKGQYLTKLVEGIKW